MKPRSPARVLAVYRHPTPYRDPLLDRVAALPGLDLHVAYLSRSFGGAPWEQQELEHAHSFPRGFLTRHLGDMAVAVHPALAWRFLKWKPDVVMISGWLDPSALALALLCRILRVPYVLGSESWRASGRAGLPRGLRDWLVDRIVAGASAWLPTGTRARELLVRHGADPLRCHFFPTASDHRRWAECIEAERASLPGPRAEYGLPADGVVTYVGRLIDVKAPDVVLEAFALLREGGRAVQMVFVGDGPLRAAMELHRAWDQVRFLGFRQPREVARILAATDVFVLASRDETWGAAAGEALAGGIPVVLSEGVGSAPDLIGARGPGAVVPVDDAVSLAAAIGSLLDDPARRSSLAEKARQRALAWGHELNLRSLLRALRDAGIDLSPQALLIAETLQSGEAARAMT